MTNVSKPVSGATSPSVPAEAGERRGKAGEFEGILAEKTRRPAEARPGARERAAEAAGREHSTPRDARPGARDAQEGAEGRTSSAAETRRDAALEARALPGDVVMPPAVRWEAPVEATARADVSETIAQIERLAEQIVRAAEVRLGPGGAAEARLELSLGELGSLKVALERDAEGGLAVRFEEAGAEAAGLLRAQASELAERLEARGVHLREISVEGNDETTFRFQPPREEAAEREGQPSREGDDQRRQHSRREPEAPAPAEDEP